MKRYHLKFTGKPHLNGYELVEHPDGEFVSHEDLLAAVRAERERCAKVCEELVGKCHEYNGSRYALRDAAAEIRKGGAE